MLRRKQEVLQRLRDQYAVLRQTWGGEAGYDAWVAAANNVSLAALGSYDGLVPGFEALHARAGGNWQSFYDAVRRIAALPHDARRQALTEGR